MVSLGALRIGIVALCALTPDAHAQKGRMVENLRLAAPREKLLGFFRRIAPTVERAERAERLA